jgi:diguanylate cyclase (GGDEF)-like protein
MGMSKRDASIRTKLAAAFGAALVLVVVTGAIGLIQISAISGVTQEIRDVWLPKLSALSGVKRSMTAHELLATRRTQSLDFRQLAAVSREIDAVEQTLASQVHRYAGMIGTPEERQRFAAMQAAWAAYTASFAEVLDRINSGEVSGAISQFESGTRSTLDQARAELEALEQMAEAGTSAAEDRAGEMYRHALLQTAVVVLLSAIAVAVLIYWASVSISSPLLRVSRAMQRLTEGDDTATISDGADRHDEIGTLIAAVAGYRDSVIRARELAELAETDRRRMYAAISNMPIGFCMFDDEDRLVVCNEKYAEIYKLPPEATVPGTQHRMVIAARVATETYNGTDPMAHMAEVLEIVKARRPSADVWELKDGRSISTIFQPVAGGWLSTHEDITERRRSEARIRHMARHDALTDLPNRTLFRERVGEALLHLPGGGGFAVLALDLDRFKNVNDTLGHPVGDLLLQAVAERLRHSVRESDTVARFGGDEFAMVQVDSDQPAAARSLAQRVIEVLSEPFDVDGQQISIGVSVGIALAPGDGQDAEQLLKGADMGLYRAKSDGRGVYRFFEPEMDARMQARRRLELDLRRALAEDQFLLHYQPVMDVERGQVTCFEALLRWRHPERGMISPGEFIPLTEDIGLIVPLGEWILRQACRDAAAWPENIKVAVNLSPVQFRSNRLIEAVITALAVGKLPASRLELEITEGVLLAETEETLATLHRLRTLGVRIAMDDFGTGYSSLSYLQSFPFDRIKIDASFIRRMDSDASSTAIVRAVTGLGASLGMQTTAEGVETAEQLNWVRAEGCTEVQGFLFSEARPAAELPILIEKLQARGMAAA